MKTLTLLVVLLLFFNSFKVTSVFGENISSPPDITSESAILMEANSGQILFEKNKSKQMYPASLTKIATAIYAIENGQLNDEVTISEKANSVDGTRVYLEVGEKVALKKLIQGLLINSGNDAGIAIAEHLSGNVEQFSNDLNLYLKDVIGVENTNFENPHGLFNSEHLTTAEDLAKITQYAMKNKTFKEIFGTKELKWDGETWDTTLITHHKILKGEIPYEQVTGGKNGYVNQSGFTLATTAENDNISLIVITLKSSNEELVYRDTVKLLDYGFENYRTSTIKEDTTFSVADEMYKTNKTLYYTYPSNDQIVNKVDKNGNLRITNQANNMITTFKLEKINSKIENKGTTEIKATKNDLLISSIINSQIVIIFSILVIYLSFMSLMSRYKSKHQ